MKIVILHSEDAVGPPADPVRLAAPERRLPAGALEFQPDTHPVRVLVARDHEGGRRDVAGAEPRVVPVVLETERGAR